ncbi:3-oxoacyl-[acyl-carrier-protein] reductase [Xanthomarina sp. F1114]|uniref:3-oxoacyl-[acyl-carrier-protein] reductase n=1 Tax=Xanthomarina sp. F1114 TaxID=2996019 RepID=UPI00225DD983|nr:3-oxoacyl-[acyl-carrier-protein] reductase [Xanthomarina sp. F1114]MCX7548933.1 3-oxoacyl-[acyl-carrier-protein] reductase [Xanthomarina sp. F1114]
MGLLNNKIAVITGGSNGIGKATVLKFIAEGAKVIIWDIIKEKGEKLEKELQKEGHNVYFMEVNTSSSEAVEKATQKTLEAHTRIDILINNAGITRDATLLKMTQEQWQQVIDVNLTGVYNCTRHIAPVMVENGFGVILNASSVVGLYGNFGQTNYAATKAGVIAMTQTWARELGRKGIRVNAVAPGFILTDMVKAMPEEVLDKMAKKVPLQELGTPEDIANIYAFLSSDQARYISGTTISVDGGITL